MPVMRLRCAKTADRVEVLFGVETLVKGTLYCTDGDPDAPTAIEGPASGWKFTHSKI